MVWSNWQGAIWRGAMLVLLCWSGLAWTQTPAQRSNADPAERIMVVHENGKSTRCRVVESWSLPDGRVAHLLQALDTGEMITIVDEPSPGSVASANPRAMPKRIFTWGQGRRTPPEGSPIPPHLRQDSGIVIKNEQTQPVDAVAAQVPTIVNRVIDEKSLGGSFGTRNEGTTILVVPESTKRTGPTLIQRLFTKKETIVERPAEPQVIDFQKNPIVQAGGNTSKGQPGPTIINEQPKKVESNLEIVGEQPRIPPVNTTTLPPIVVPGTKPETPQPITSNTIPTPANPNVRPIPSVTLVGEKPTPAGTIVREPNTNIQPVTPGTLVGEKPVTPLVATPLVVDPSRPETTLPGGSNTKKPWRLATNLLGTPKTETPMRPIASSTNQTPANPNVKPGTVKTGEVENPITPSTATPSVGDPSRPESSKPTASSAKKPWRPGANLQAWMQGTPASGTPKTEPTKPDQVKADEAKKQQKAEDFLVQQNKMAEKKLASKIETTYKAPFSTAMATPSNLPPEVKKPEPAPLAMPGKAMEVKPIEKPVSLPAPPVRTNDEKIIILPPDVTKDDSIKTAGALGKDKRDMWGTAVPTPVPPPGRTLLEPSALKQELVKLPPPPASRMDDPLMAPERFNPNNDRLKPKLASLPPAPPAPRVTPEARVAPKPWDTDSNPPPVVRETQGVNWPLGTQSVQAAKSGLLGPVTYIPVPTVTVPQPHTPPAPPAPKLPDAPQLNTYVNAFSAPPAPKAAPPQNQMQGMMPPQAMAYQNNPMMNQQQMMMQQQMMAQQQTMAQQQAMMQYGYRPNSAMTNPYMQQSAMASQGPTMNYSRQYMGPAAPNPFGGNQAMQASYTPSNYPPMMPMNSMMPQQQSMQPVSYQQQPMPTQQQAITQQVEQLIKVLRESPYPAQREWAAQSLTSFEWRAHPQIVPALIQSASQDPAASVRAGCVYCLGRMNAAVEPVFGVLHAMRNDIDPRVRQEVEQAFVRLGQSPMMPQ